VAAAAEPAHLVEQQQQQAAQVRASAKANCWKQQQQQQSQARVLLLLPALVWGQAPAAEEGCLLSCHLLGVLLMPTSCLWGTSQRATRKKS
jgi:hypothetical protein